MILLSIIVAALGVISLVCLLIVVWPPPRDKPLDRPDPEHLNNLRPLGNVDRVEK